MLKNFLIFIAMSFGGSLFTFAEDIKESEEKVPLNKEVPPLNGNVKPTHAPALSFPISVFINYDNHEIKFVGTTLGLVTYNITNNQNLTIMSGMVEISNQTPTIITIDCLPEGAYYLNVEFLGVTYFGRINI